MFHQNTLKAAFLAFIANAALITLCILFSRVPTPPQSPYAPVLALSVTDIQSASSCYTEHYIDNAMYCYLRMDSTSSAVFTFTEGVYSATSFSGVDNVRIGDLYAAYGRAFRIERGRFYTNYVWVGNEGRIIAYARNDSMFSRVNFIRFEHTR